MQVFHYIYKLRLGVDSFVFSSWINNEFENAIYNSVYLVCDE